MYFKKYPLNKTCFIFSEVGFFLVLEENMMCTTIFNDIFINIDENVEICRLPNLK